MPQRCRGSRQRIKNLSIPNQQGEALKDEAAAAPPPPHAVCVKKTNRKYKMEEGGKNENKMNMLRRRK